MFSNLWLCGVMFVLFFSNLVFEVILLLLLLSMRRRDSEGIGHATLSCKTDIDFNLELPFFFNLWEDTHWL